MVEVKFSDRSRVARTLFYLLAVPMLFISAPILLSIVLPLFHIYTLTPAFVAVLVLYPMAFYLLWLFHKVPYSDTEVLEKVIIPNAPKEIEEQLKTLSKNHLVNVNLIAILGNSRSLNQTEIVDRLHEIGIDLTATRIREILQKLESKELGLVSSMRGTYERDYRLTERGQWCLAAIKLCFPKRYIYFLIRHQLRRKKLPAFPQVIEPKENASVPDPKPASN